MPKIYYINDISIGLEFRGDYYIYCNFDHYYQLACDIAKMFTRGDRYPSELCQIDPDHFPLRAKFCKELREIEDFVDGLEDWEHQAITEAIEALWEIEETAMEHCFG